MSGYDIFLSTGDLLATINVKTVDPQGHSSLVLIGQGIPNYGAEIAQNFVWMLEHFSSATPPVNPLIGQLWHDNSNDVMRFYDDNGNWRQLLNEQNSASAQFSMLPAATNIDFTTVQDVVIFTAPDLTKSYLPSILILVPNGSVSNVTVPTFNVHVSTTGDVVASMTPTFTATNQFLNIRCNATTRLVNVDHQNITISITTAATGGALHYDAYIFGFVT